MNVWEHIHATSSWGRYPCEELVRFMGRTFLRLPYEQRKQISILEIGTGQGANIWFLLNEGFDVYGIDISPSAIQKMAELLNSRGLLPGDFENRFVVADMRQEFSFKRKFDVVIDCATTWYATYSEHFVLYRRIYDTLKPGGIFFCYHILKESWGYGTGNQIDKDTFDNTTEGPLKGQGIIYYAKIDDLTHILEDAGFKVKSVERLERTYENMKKKISIAIIIAEK